MQVVTFEEKYRQAFIDFNTDWIISNFGTLEKHDLETFAHIDENIEKGGMIFIALQDNIPAATCMTVPIDKYTWEICKLGSNKNILHPGAGSAVFCSAMEWALNHGAIRLFILSNSKLKPALHIYKKYGFKEIKLDNYEYARGDIAFEYIKENQENMELKTIVKKENALKRTFKGVNLDSLAVGEKSMVTKMNYVAGNYATEHTHPHEQCGYVISGKYRMTIRDQVYILTSGDSYAVPGNVPHAFEVLEDGEVVDVFTPHREDYL